jgi:hypothetical protein
MRRKGQCGGGTNIVITLIAITLGACQTIGEPVEVGKDRYKMTFWGSDNDGPPRAQAFCRKSGFAYAEVSYSLANDMEFLCMHEGDNLVPQSSKTTVCLPGLDAGDPIICNSN